MPTRLRGAIEDVSENCEVHGPDSLRSLHMKLASISVAENVWLLCDDFNDRNPGGWTKDMASYFAQHLERFLRKLRELVDSEFGMMVTIL
jgi:hypothetical protein